MDVIRAGSFDLAPTEDPTGIVRLRRIGKIASDASPTFESITISSLRN